MSRKLDNESSWESLVVGLTRRFGAARFTARTRQCALAAAFAMAGGVGCAENPSDGELPRTLNAWKGDPSKNGVTSSFRSERNQGPSTDSVVTVEEALSADAQGSTDPTRHRSPLVSLFYPTRGQSADGNCWYGLVIDHLNNVYPVNGNVAKITPSGVLVNGVNDENYFMTGTAACWGALDGLYGIIYCATSDAVQHAWFRQGASFSDLISGLSLGQTLTIGRGPTRGSLFVTDGYGTVPSIKRVTLHPLTLAPFASSPEFVYPEAIASARDGTLYVVDIGLSDARLFKVTPTGEISLFASGGTPQVRRAVNVDRFGIVYWSNAQSIERYLPDGRQLTPLPGPSDEESFANPLGSAFDRDGNWYLLDNGRCKKIYKYHLRHASYDLWDASEG